VIAKIAGRAVESLHMQGCRDFNQRVCRIKPTVMFGDHRRDQSPVDVIIRVHGKPLANKFPCELIHLTNG
jgi:hypothetical protein